MSHLPAVLDRPEVAVPEPKAPAVLDAEYRLVIARPYPGPVDRPRSVALPAALAALAICGGPCLVLYVAEVIAR